MCDSCEAVMINKVHCHETGCPEAWKDYSKECKWCGNEFDPEDILQDCCDNECAEAYHGF